MKKIVLAVLSVSLVSGLVTGEEKSYDGSWESLQKMPVPAWFDDGKIGIFIHWGPYSAIGYRKGGRGYSEHVPKLIYQDPEHYYPYMKERWGATPPEFGYKDIISEFKAENWDPDAWAKLFKEVGAHYVVMTAEHHDGWANWDSDLTPWNAVDKGPHRDLVGDLGTALHKQGLKFAPSYHRERHQTFFAKRQYVVKADPQDDIVEEIKRVPEAASLYGPFGTTQEFVDSYVARWKEIQTKYHPDFLWIDDIPIWTRDGNKVRKGKAKPKVQYFDDQLRGMITDFMNQGAARGQAVYLNNKGGNRNWPDGVGCLEKDNLKLKVIGPKWESCTTFGTSFGYLEGDKYKTVEDVIHEMIEVISRNGNFLVNIGPKADGTIPEPQVERLRAMGDWLKINGDAIYGSRYWKVSEQPDEHLAFTTQGKNLYAIKLAQHSAPFVITGTAGWSAGQVKSVRLLGSNSSVSWEMTPAGLQITPPADFEESQHAWSFEIVTTEEQHHPNVMVTDETKALKNTKAVDLEGKVERPFIKSSPPQGTSIEVETASAANGFSNLPVPAASGKTVTANQKTGNDAIQTLVDGKLGRGYGPVFANGIQNGAYKMDLDSVQSVAAITSWSFNRAKTRGPQKIALYGSTAATDPGWDLKKFTPLGTIDTTGAAKANYTAASLRAVAGQSLGDFRWIVWSVSPVTANGSGENTAFQELNVELTGRAVPVARIATKGFASDKPARKAPTFAEASAVSPALTGEVWTVDSQSDWQANTADQSNLEFKDGLATPTAKEATFQSTLKTFDKKCAAESITIRQSTVWENWEPTPNIGPVNLADAPVMLSLGPDNYWMFGRYGGSKKKGFTAEDATLEGYDIPLKTTPFKNQYDAPGGLEKGQGGYHAWQSKDMVNWVHHGSITDKKGKWMTTAEYADGKAYFYYDFPNDQDPHLIIDEDLTDGKLGKDMGLAFKDPSHGSDCTFIRDLEGKFHVIAEDWSPINARTHAWDSPLATHAVSPDGIGNFKILAPAVDERTTPTGKFAEYVHPHWHSEDPKNYPGKTAAEGVPQHRAKKGQTKAFARYEIHEPEQNAYGDWASISIGGQYYLFSDFDPVGGHGSASMSVGRFTAPSIDGPFEWCGNLGKGHPDPDVMFAEGKFYLATQQNSDFTSPGPWVETVDVRVGVDTNKDGAIDQWTDWQRVKETYDTIPGFAKQVAKTPAQMDLASLPEGYGFQFEVKISDSTDNDSQPILDNVSLTFSN